MQVIRPAKNDNTIDNVYLNLQFAGSNTDNPFYPHSQMKYNQAFSEVFLNNCEDYYISCVSLSMPVHSIPLVLFQNIKTGNDQNDSNLTDFYLCFTYNNIDYGQFVQYIPSTYQSAPSPPSTNPPNYNQSISNYYNIYNYNQICRMLNNTLKTIYTHMFNDNSGTFTSYGLTVDTYPYFIFDDTESKFILIYNKNIVGRYISLFFSDSLSIKLQGMDQVFHGVKGDNKDYSFIFFDSRNNTYDSNNYMNRQGFAGSPTTFQTINQILITSSGIRGRGEYIGFSNTSQLQFPSVIFSLNPSFDTIEMQKSRLIYTSDGRGYRLVDILGQGPLREIDLSVYYTDQKNNVYPVTLAQGEVATLKLIMVKKSLFNNWP